MKKSNHIKIMVRSRPLLKFQSQPAWQIKHNIIQCMQTKTARTALSKNIANSKLKHVEEQMEEYKYEFESIVEESITTEKMYKKYLKEQMRKNIENGVNSSIMAYGQTCSGKTYTILGVKQQPGIIPCLLRQLFLEQKQSTFKFQYKISYFQLYNQKIYDLLNQNSSNTANKPLSDQKISQDSQILHITKQQILSFEESLHYLQKGQKNRSYNRKENHERSSRSHTIMRIVTNISYILQYIQKWDTSYQKISSMINVVDLAGSERIGEYHNANNQVANRNNVSETASINLSLFQLSNVLCKLSNSQQHIPYRNSKLTKILQKTLKEEGQCYAIFCISTAAESFNQTLSTLRLAQKTKKIELKPITIKIEKIGYQHYQEEIQALKNKLEAKDKECEELYAVLDELQEKIYFLEQEIKDNKDNKDKTINASRNQSKHSSKQNQKSIISGDYSKNIIKSMYFDSSENLIDSPIKQKSNRIRIEDKDNRQVEGGQNLYIWGCRKDHRVCKGNTEKKTQQMVHVGNLGKLSSIVCGYHHSFVLNESGEVLGWGQNQHSQINQQSSSSISIPTKVHELKGVTMVAAGWAHTLALLSSGEVCSWGFGKDGQLGHGNKQSLATPKTVTHTLNVKSIFAGHSHSGFLDKHNDFYTFGFNKDYRLMIGESTEVDFPCKVAIRDVISASLGVNHSAIICKNGELYCGGVGTHGELGVLLQSNVQDYQTIEVLDRQFSDQKYQKVSPLLQCTFFNSVHNPAKKVLCGENMTAVLNQKGQVFTFGKATASRLGHQNSTPTKILQNISDIAIGCRHGIALEKQTNKLYSWGFNLYGQANFNNSNDVQNPMVIQHLPNKDITGIACGFFHTSILTK